MLAALYTHTERERPTSINCGFLVQRALQEAAANRIKFTLTLLIDYCTKALTENVFIALCCT